MAKAELASIDGLPDALKSEYVARDGKFYLKVEGAHPDFVPAAEANENKARLTEFRDNNRTLFTENTTLKAQLEGFKGIDPAKYTELQTKVKELEGASAGKGADAEKRNRELVEAALKPVLEKVGGLETKLKQTEEEAARGRAELARKSFENSLLAMGQKAGVDSAAAEDFVRRAMETFRVVDGKIVPMNGDTPVFSKKTPAAHLSVEEWIEDTRAKAPYFFAPSAGGGAAGAAGSGAGNGGAAKGNPNAKILKNPTPQQLGQFMDEIAAGTMIVQND